MNDVNKCPKCGYTSDVVFEECLKCGVITENFLKREKKIEELDKQFHKVEKTLKKDTSKNLFITIISKTWLWPVPLMLIQLWVLFASESIWEATTAMTNTRVIYKVNAAQHTIIGLVVIPLVYWLTYTQVIPALLHVYRPSEVELGCANILMRALVFLALCWNTYAIIIKYG